MKEILYPALIVLPWVLFCVYMARKSHAKSEANARVLAENNALVRCSIGLMCGGRLFRRADMLALPESRYCCSECQPTLDDTDVFGTRER
jgi:hypothetical protein